MRVAGIVCEYNPFHNGHLYHLKQAAASPDGEYIVCVQSSNFLQRGQPALLPKNLRAESAIKNGADLVFDLPFVFSCSSAEYYASAAVLMLGRLGIADSLVFGSESNNLPLLKKIADLLLDEPYDYRRILKDNLGKGFSFAKARALALGEYFNDSQTIELIEGSNNILAVEYLKAIKKFNLPINPVLVHRIGSAYKDEEIKNIHPSATAIRKSIISKGVSSVIDYIPTATYKLLDAFYKDHANYINIEMLRDAIFYRIASLSPSELRSYPGISEGFETPP